MTNVTPHQHTRLVIGLDLGTSACKAALFDLQGQRLAVSRVAYETATHCGEVRQHPQEWATAALRALAALSPRSTESEIIGIGLSGQIGTHVLLNTAGEPLADAVTWQDGRSSVFVQEVEDRIDGTRLRIDLDTRLPPGAAWPLVRMLWLSRAQPDLFWRATWIAQPKDFLIKRLTGEVVSDASSWRGVARPDGSIATDALDLLGLPNLIPHLMPPTVQAGGLLPEAAEETGLPPGLPVFVGMNDLNCSLLGIGGVASGCAFDVAGTSEHIGYISSCRDASPSINSVPLHGSDTSLYSVYGVTSNGGSVAEWLNQVLTLNGDGDGQSGSEACLSTLAERSEPGARGLLFLPYLRGERAPVWNARSRGALVGLSQSHDRADIARAALEGVAYNLRQILDALPAPGDAAIEVLATGGPTRISIWNEIKASVLRRPIQLLKEPESAALGAAMIAALGCKQFGSARDAAASMVSTSTTVYPSEQSTAVYDDAYTRYRQLYPALGSLTSPQH